MNSSVSLAHFEPRHGIPVELVEEISPRTEKRIVFGDLPRVLVGAGGKLSGYRWGTERKKLLLALEGVRDVA